METRKPEVDYGTKCNANGISNSRKSEELKSSEENNRWLLSKFKVRGSIHKPGKTKISSVVKIVELDLVLGKNLKVVEIKT